MVWNLFKVQGITKDGLKVDAFVYAPSGWVAIRKFEEDNKLTFSNASSCLATTENVWR